MGEAPDRIVEEIEQGREALDRDLRALEARIRQRTDWRTQIRRHPWIAIATAIAVGYAVARLIFPVSAASRG